MGAGAHVEDREEHEVNARGARRADVRLGGRPRRVRRYALRPVVHVVKLADRRVTGSCHRLVRFRRQRLDLGRLETIGELVHLLPPAPKIVGLVAGRENVRLAAQRPLERVRVRIVHRRDQERHRVVRGRVALDSGDDPRGVGVEDDVLEQLAADEGVARSEARGDAVDGAEQL